MRARNFKERLQLALFPPLASWTLRGLAATWRVAEAGHTSLAPKADPRQPFIYAVWHENALSAGFYRGRPVHALASHSFDGELISRTLVRLGWLPPARGSSSRGGGTALKESLGFLARGEHVLYTVDGPRGPRRVAKNGAIQLARLSGRAVVPAVFACVPEFRLKSWDRMLLPPPFARGVFWYGKELRFEREDRGIEEGLRRLQHGLDQAVENAGRFLKGTGGAAKTD